MHFTPVASNPHLTHPVQIRHIPSKPVASCLVHTSCSPNLTHPVQTCRIQSTTDLSSPHHMRFTPVTFSSNPTHPIQTCRILSSSHLMQPNLTHPVQTCCIQSTTDLSSPHHMRFTPVASSLHLTHPVQIRHIQSKPVASCPVHTSCSPNLTHAAYVLGTPPPCQCAMALEHIGSSPHLTQPVHT